MAQVAGPQVKRKGDSSKKDLVRTTGPDVIVDFIFEDGLLFISLWNIGDKPAYAVRVKFDQKIIGIEGSKVISSLPLFRNLEFLAPGKQIRTFLDSSASYFNRKQPTLISLHVRFMDAESQKYSKSIKHNLEIYRNIGYVRRGDTDCNGPVFSHRP